MAIICDHVPRHPSPPTTFSGRVAILIPAYNEARHLPRVIEACRALRPALVLVIDDCSTDDSADVLAAAAGVDEDGVRVMALRNPYNLGKQGTVRRGLRLLAPCDDLHAVALMDGDGQHDARELPRLATLLDSGYDAVIGARSREQMPPQRKLANWLVNSSFAVFAGVHFATCSPGCGSTPRSWPTCSDGGCRWTAASPSSTSLCRPWPITPAVAAGRCATPPRPSAAPTAMR